MQGFILYKSLYVHVSSIVGDFRHLPDDGLLDCNELVVSDLRILLFFPVGLVADDGRVGVFDHLNPGISGALVSEIAI